MIYLLAGICVLLVAALAIEKRQNDRRLELLLKDQAVERGGWNLERTNLIHANDSERETWRKERRDLNNRIQVPQAAPFMASDEEPQPQHVPFDDDEAFAEAQKELMEQWP